MKVSSSYRSTTSVYSATTSRDSDSGSTQQTQGSDTNIGVYTGSLGSDKDDGIAATLGGGAIAVGEDTAAIGSIAGKVYDVGTAAIAEGSATFTASSEASDGELTYASASTYGEASAADTLVTVTSTRSESTRTSDESRSTETSTTNLLAVDLNLSSASDGSGTNAEWSGSGSGQQSHPSGEDVSSSGGYTIDGLDGNVAIIEIDVTAYGDDTLVLVDASALTFEDGLSVIDGYAWFGVG
ncbi:hypothetical protein [Microvirga lotononidis]|uniref:Uncharacterized protein n=1 Tax=Microvirga lotononidis TaxID=864069 RepID=I4Z2R4_9HYPH|nr:hypothetical protein [Microvirga lotononidis]EIM30506.1 hypothetical protein MicloDRAFT_00007560 [Microvirga lotononidis]WQO26342.1 hypothetical protein U0023_16805 [Microvirga lotononidis]